MDNILAVIPCLNEEAHIEGLVQQLIRNNQSLPMQIIIADGGSTDHTAEIAQKLAAQHDNVHYLHNPKRLQSAAINLAVATYGEKAEFLIRLDAHADYPDDYCTQLRQEAIASGAASVVVAMDTQGKTPFQEAVAIAQNSKLGNGGASHRSNIAEGRWVDHGHHALMRIAAFKAVGGYDEGFSHNEDAEFDTRLIKAGYKIWLTAKTKLIYYPRSSAAALFRQYYNYGRGRLQTIVKHHARPKLRQLLPVAVAPALLLAFFAPLSGLFALPFIGWAAICLGYGWYLDNITAGFAAILMHLGWSLGFWRGATTELRKRIA